MNMESSPKQVESIEKNEQYTEKELKERFFLALIIDKVFEDYENDMYDADFDEGDVKYFRSTISKMNDDDAKTVLSLPADIRINFFKKFLEKCKNGEFATKDLAKYIINISKERGYTLGYHCSIKNIERRKGQEWKIIGTELDDRDDMKMAYYSVDYENFYRKKPAKYIYLVRAETGSDSAHKLDMDNRWSRAPSLSIVSKVDLHEIDEEIKEHFKK